MGNDKHHANEAFSLDEVRELIKLVSGSDINELTIERDDARFHIKRGIPAPAPVMIQAPMHHMPHMGDVMMAAPTSTSTPSAPAAAAEPVISGHQVTSPMVGTFYTSPSPKDAPFVNEGDTVKVGDALCIVEAMKMMNSIEADVAGRVVKILAKNGQPVEFGQPLIIIDPSA
ncbi:MAG: acetyl-CoA carboxylase biotin carboxyl carrier protein [Chloroflexi bacterium]|nr:acetyl-CoA carboxylase biotin carboxyl carrier protein [Chloroflexota bacterium]